MRILAIIVLALTLTACGAGKTLVVEETHIVVMPPEGLWNCPNVPAPPSGGYRQAEVADYVLKIYEAHQVCKAAIEDVKRYLEQAQLITEKVEK
jgi:hypothetical protein